MPKLGVSGPVVGQHLDLTKQRVGQLVDENVFARLSDGSFDLDACRVAYIRWLRSDERRASKAVTTSRFQEARAADLEQRTAERNKDLLKQAQAEAISVIDEFYGGLRSDLMAIPARVTADIALRRRIEDGIDDAFGASAKRSLAAADHIEAASETLRAAAKRNARRMGAGKSGLPAKPWPSRAA